MDDDDNQGQSRRRGDAREDKQTKRVRMLGVIAVALAKIAVGKLFKTPTSGRLRLGVVPEDNNIGATTT
jgi:hypothetical protein